MTPIDRSDGKRSEREPASFEAADADGNEKVGGDPARSTDVVDIAMPRLIGSSGRLVAWHVRDADVVSAGEVIADVAGPEATLEVEAEVTGRIVSLCVAEGSADIPAGTTIARLAPDAGHESAVAAETIPPDQSGAPVAAAADPEREAAFPPVSDRSAAREEPGDHDIDTPRRSTTLRRALADAIVEEMDRDPRVVVIGEDVGNPDCTNSVFSGLLERFGDDRVIDVPVCEAGFTGLGIGAALGGLRPIVEFQHFSFALQAMDQIVNEAAKLRYLSAGKLEVPVVFRGPNGPSPGAGGQVGQNFAAWFASVPGLIVVAPSNPADAKGLLKKAIRTPDPVVFLETETLYATTGGVPETVDHLCPFGAASVVRSGDAVTLVSYGAGVELCVQAARRLEEDGLEAEVIDLRTLRPIDDVTIFDSVRKTHRLVTVEPGWVNCGIGAEIAARVTAHCFDDLDAPPTRVTTADIPLPCAANLETLTFPSASDVVVAARKVCYL